MSHKHAAVLRAIFHDPISANIHYREVESLLHNLGAEILPGHGARFRVVLNRVEGTLHHPHGGTLSKQDVKSLREYLSQAGVTPSTYEDRGD
jgi:hypothetical protein